jgi:glycosyltransferase involved in cell wall biosynthesis
MIEYSVAIITRTRNRPALLGRAIESVLEQRFQDWVHVIVNDGGAPAEVDALVARYRDYYAGRLQVIHNPESLGMEAASNVGVRHSQSQYLVIHDDDDTWHPDFLQRCVAYLESPPSTLDTPVAGVVTWSHRIIESFDGSQAKTLKVEPLNTWLKEISLYRLAANNPFPPISFVFSRQALDQLGGFREDLPVLGDWHFHLRFAAQFEIGLIPELLANYHYRDSADAGIYGNTVTAGEDRHRRYDLLLRNDWLRADLQAGQLGLGFLVNFVASVELMNRNVERLFGTVQRLKSFGPLRWLYYRLNR